jgi:hypothetical protein
MTGTDKSYYNKEYYEKNKEIIIQINLQYYNANKDRLNTKIICKCFGRYTYKNKSQHLKSKIHQNYLHNLNNSTDDSE